MGSAAEMAQIIASNPSLSKLMSGMTVRGIGMRLSKYSKTPGSGVAAKKHSFKGSPTTYYIHPPAKV